jgi:hypothetical protein
MARADHEVPFGSCRSLGSDASKPQWNWAPTTKPGVRDASDHGRVTTPRTLRLTRLATSPALTKAGSALPSEWATQQVTALAMPKVGPKAWMRPSKGSNVEPADQKLERTGFTGVRRRSRRRSGPAPVPR